MQETVKSLREKGYKVKCFHSRKEEKLADKGIFALIAVISPKGGKTEVQLIDPNGIRASGEAKCSDKENYCRKTGVKIALGRALKELERAKRIQKLVESQKESKKAYKDQFKDLSVDPSYNPKEDWIKEFFN